MKTGMELVDAWRSESLELLPCKPDESIAIDLCADQLEAWLREADKAMLKLAEDDAYIANLIRYELLGTTQSSRGSRGSREGEK